MSYLDHHYESSDTTNTICLQQDLWTHLDRGSPDHLLQDQAHTSLEVCYTVHCMFSTKKGHLKVLSQSSVYNKIHFL